MLQPYSNEKQKTSFVLKGWGCPAAQRRRHNHSGLQRRKRQLPHERVRGKDGRRQGGVRGRYNFLHQPNRVGQISHSDTTIYLHFQGQQDFQSIAISADAGETFVGPCGACRQTMCEFNPRLKLFLVQNKLIRLTVT